MRFHFWQMDAPSARLIVAWRYEPPYDVYDILGADVEAEVRFFTDPRNDYYTIANDTGDMVAMCCFGLEAQVPGGDYHDDALDLGLGVRPDLTGHGRGTEFVAAVIDYAQRTFAPRVLRVTIAEFNQRALRVWQQFGFIPQQHFPRRRDGRRFVVLRREEAAE